MRSTISQKQARADYYAWLVYRYGSIDLLEIKDEPDPISLRKIYVPLRLDTQDREENHQDLADPENFPQEKQLLGQSVLDCLLEQPYLMISGRPGAGKTTLIKALIYDLCHPNRNPLRDKLQSQYQDIFSIPIILRELEQISKIKTVDDLLAQWWQQQIEDNQRARELNSQIKALDPKQLPRSLAACQQQQLHPLILLDGMDEIGSLKTRQQLIQIAEQLQQQACHLIITGRPGGLDDLKHNAKKYWIQPFTRPQIQHYIKQWYSLSSNWVNQLKTSPADFLNALADPKRQHLLSLARRAIFLSLMALVHTSRQAMPQGRAALYDDIISIYLERQQKQRQNRLNNPQGKALPHWNTDEPRRVLAYIAYISMQKGIKQADKDDADQRRILWNRQDLQQSIADFIANAPRVLRFRELDAAQAADLLDYFLYPAGLLIAPIEQHIQFAHLSFQEFLAAEHIHSQMLGADPYSAFEQYICTVLDQAGWQEVALLLLALRQDKLKPYPAHFDILAQLDLSNFEQARLFVEAILGQALPLDQQDRQDSLGLLLIAALLHPGKDLLAQAKNYPELSPAGSDLIQQLLKQDTAADIWQIVQAKAADFPSTTTPLLDTAQARWLSPPNDLSWEADFEQREAQHHALLGLILSSGWAYKEDEALQPCSTALQQALTHWYQQQQPLLWQNHHERYVITATGLALDALADRDSDLLQCLQQQMPLDLWLLQGERWDSLSMVLLGLRTEKKLSPRYRLSLALYQLQLLIEQSYLLSLSLSWSLSRLRSLSLSRSRSWPWLWSKSLPWYFKQLNDIKTIVDEHSLTDKTAHPFKESLCLMDSTWAAADWFKTDLWRRVWQAEGASCRELPLPYGFEACEDGIQVKTRQTYQDWQALKTWADDDDNWLAWVFAGDLSADDEKILRADLQQLRQREWSPFAFLDRALEKWREQDPNLGDIKWDVEIAEAHLRHEADKLLKMYPIDKED